MAPVPVSVVVPTIGRPQQLRSCLESLSQCRPRASEILVVDQSGLKEVESVVHRFRAAGARTVQCAGRGIAVALNVGLEAAAYDIVLVTHDDCTVAPSWVGRAWALMSPDPRRIITGRVLPAGDPEAVPSTKTDLTAHDYTGEIRCTVLFPNNMALSREMVVASGGFDERFDTAAEDNDLCYRWLRAGYRLQYEPALVVWHHEWRTREELERLYASYGEAQGRFYAKHLRAGDATMLRFMAGDLHAGLRALAAAAFYGDRRRSDTARHIRRGIVRGLVRGWREFDGTKRTGAGEGAFAATAARRSSALSRRPAPRSLDRGDGAPPA
jgi:GT2 family glycosyltransferase